MEQISKELVCVEVMRAISVSLYFKRHTFSMVPSLTEGCS
ncbi:hypothetical protein CEXT_280431, partial [Caerostris extrusa]